MSSVGTQGEILEEEKRLGVWPRRLLHIPTWTSYEWQHGNRYGEHENPSYNVISYTWGRYRLKDEDKPEVKAIHIKGVDWEIPRIDPEHFTANEFKRMIVCATMRPSERLDESKVDYVPDVEFVWLDVACIDQRPDRPRSHSEVGRQAYIFSQARRAYAWITSHNTFKLKEALRAVMNVLAMKNPELRKDFGLHPGPARIYLQLNNNKTRPWKPPQTIDDTSIEARSYSAVERLLSDPWFTSVWTLQECFISLNIIFISRGAAWATIPWASDLPRRSNYMLDLDTLLLTGKKGLFARASHNATGGKSKTPSESFERTLKQSGLSAISARNPVAAYYAGIVNRKATDAEDHVYGVQQLLGLRLGRTAPGYAGDSFSITQLREQMSKEILVKHVVDSQLHTFSKAAEFGCAWIPNRHSDFSETLLWDSAAVRNIKRGPTTSTSKFPELMEKEEEEEEEPSCSFRVEKFQEKDCGVFEGRTIPFHSLVSRIDWARVGFLGNLSHLYIELDESTELSSRLEDDRLGRDLLAGHKAPRLNSIPAIQKREMLLETFQESELFVLELQKIPGTGPSGGGWGLILLHQKKCGYDEYYHRLGCCKWSDLLTVSNLTEATNRADWVWTKGFFG